MVSFDRSFLSVTTAEKADSHPTRQEEASPKIRLTMCKYGFLTTKVCPLTLGTEPQGQTDKTVGKAASMATRNRKGQTKKEKKFPEDGHFVLIRTK